MKLLFICTHNRCRSILSEAITKHLGGTDLIAASAGSSPQGEIHPLTIEYLTEKKVSTKDLQSQSWHEFEGFEPDVVLTMCDNAAKETCPLWFNRSIQVNWALTDPSKDNIDKQQQKDAFFNTMDIIERRIKAVLELNHKALNSDQLKTAFDDIGQKIN